MISITADEVAEKLIKYGMFPEKAFFLSSERFGKLYLKKPESFKSFLEILEKFDYTLYFQSKNSSQIRKLQIPHPAPYLNLCLKIKKHWNEIQSRLNSTIYYDKQSRIKPSINNKNHRLISMKSYNKQEDEEDLYLELSIGKRFMVKADISNFFPSIYTHSIPWATMGRANAKKDRKTGYGNALDLAIRNCQSEETIGIPIGPDTSGIISEIIMSVIDAKFDIYLRFIDDYTAFFESREDAENFILKLQKELLEFRLSINLKKTEILELPINQTEDWVYQCKDLLKSFSDNFSTKLKSPTNLKQLKKEINELFDRITTMSKKFGSSAHIERYISQSLINLKIDNADILGFFINRFGSFSFHNLNTCDSFVKFINTQNSLMIDEVSDAISNTSTILLKEAIRLSRSDAAASIIWLIANHNIAINLDSANLEELERSIIESKDNVVISLYSRTQKFSSSYLDNLKILIKEIITDEDQEVNWFLLNSHYDIICKMKLQKKYIYNRHSKLLKDKKIDFINLN